LTRKGQKHIEIKGARVHNLKNIDVKIPHNQLIVVTGLSGSGKSSLAFDTLYAEGQRRYVESLSSYARQFLGRFDKPDVDYIKGIAPAIAIEQKVISSNPRSTVGTVTEIFDYLKVLFARVGRTYSPLSGKEVKKQNVTDVVDLVQKFVDGEKYLVLAPWHTKAGKEFQQSLSSIISQGYTRILVDKTELELEGLKSSQFKAGKTYVIIDRLKHQRDNQEDYLSRLGDSIQTAFSQGFGAMTIYRASEEKFLNFSNRFELDGQVFIEPSVHFFTFNNPFGACQTCEGFGSTIGIDPDLVIPDKSRSIYDGAVAPWRGESMEEWKFDFIKQAKGQGISIHRPYADLSEKEIELLWKGSKEVKGIQHFFDYLTGHAYKIQYRIILSRYRGKTICPDCRGTRLRKETNNVRIGESVLSDLLLKPVSELNAIFRNFKISTLDQKIASRLLTEISSRLTYLCDVGLGYLTLSRASSTLSGGESQRINLSTSIGSSLVGSIYILDEPSIGLHPRDTGRLLTVLQKLRDTGNTVVVVEHEEEVMNAADQILDIGPMAGVLGGEVVFQGTKSELVHSKKSLTAQYLTGKLQIPVPDRRRKLKDKLVIKGARENNLKNITVEIPLNGLVCISGVSGSGKSSLVKNIFYPAVLKHLQKSSGRVGDFDGLSGDIGRIQEVEMVDQNPIGRSSRSNPATYVKAFDYIRDLMSREQISKIRGYQPGHFSYNVPGGRCENCKGEGEITISMQFMADVRLECEECKGKRYTSETLDVYYREKNISDILNLTITEAVTFFEGRNNLEKKILERIKPLDELGLGYLKLGQSSSTLSGGEAQRVKLASFLNKDVSQHPPTLFIFDEPTTGLHFHDINKLMTAFNELIRLGHSILVIEHNVDVLKCADWIIDIGPEGGKEGGHLVFSGTPENLAQSKASYTGKFLKQKLQVAIGV